LQRLALLPTTGGDPRDLTIAFDREVDSGSVRWASDSQALLFTAGSEGNREIYRVTIADANVEKMIGGIFEATGIDLASDGSIAYAASTPTNPSELMWRPANATEAQQMTHVNANFLNEVIVQNIHELRFTSPSGQEIQGWYLLPVGYEAGKTYPLAFNIHGGPYAMWGPATQSMWHEWQVHAASGYAVFFCNPRGGDGYGEAFRMALHADWGDIAYADLMAGVDAVIEQGFVDPQRMVVTGGSYGGYMTAWIIGHSDRFTAAVAQRGVYNLMSFYGVTDIPLFLTDQYDATPIEDPTRLWQQSPLAYADHINTPLLIIHSENDFRVPISDGEQLFSAIKLRGGKVEFIRYPREGHELSRSGEPAHRASRLQHMLAWFDNYCDVDKINAESPWFSPATRNFRGEKP
jgi:dipeptidyl aminopeptidase/acylaminoacyl peptidase